MKGLIGLLLHVPDVLKLELALGQRSQAWASYMDMIGLREEPLSALHFILITDLLYHP